MEKISILLFDLDGTLYDPANGYIDHIRNNIFEFIYQKEFISRDKSALEFWEPLFKKYNQTRRGLISEGYSFDDDEYWSSQRSGVERFLQIDPGIRSFVESFPNQRKFIFTNCHETQAGEALRCLGILDCFDGIVGAGFMGNHCKPEPIVYEKLFSFLQVTDPSTVCLIEDSFKNLMTAKNFGIATILVDSLTATQENVTETQKECEVDACLPNLSNFQEALIILRQKEELSTRLFSS